jgi:transcriptional regulator with XRE-family HTH domain
MRAGDKGGREVVRVRSLRHIREAMGLSPFDLAREARCPVEILLRAEFGIAVPHGEVRRRLASAYRLPPAEYLRLALDAAERAAG